MNGTRLTRPRRLATGMLFVLAVVLGAQASVSPAGASYGPPGKAEANPSSIAPLSGSVVTPSMSWATVLMGKNDGDFDLFWQLFAWKPSSSQWSLATPPGVADNGGLMIAPSATGENGIVGFGVSQGLRFSPLAFTSDGAASWTPGGLPSGLVEAPTVLGVNPFADTLALIGGKDPAVLRQDGGPTSWKRLVSEAELRRTPAGRTCGLAALESVSYDPHGTPTVGVACREPDTPGVLVDSDSQWHLADIPVPTELTEDVFNTFRLNNGSALLTGEKRGTTDVVAVWEPVGNQPWSMSPPLRLARASDLLASGEGPDTTQFVVVGRKGGSRQAEIISGPGSTWQALPTLPTGTATIAFEPSGALVALSVKTTVCTVWQLGAQGSWEPVQTIKVPIAFGSSA